MSDDVSITRDNRDNPGGYARVFEFLRDQLISGRLRTGDRLLPERELALKLEVSRPVIREVLRGLAAIGVIEIRHGHGSFVRQPDMSELGDIFTLMLAQKPDVTDDIMEARIAIERQALRLACTRSTRGDIAALEEAMRKIEVTMNDPVQGGEADFRFHETLVAAAHSPTLSSLYAAISNLLRRSHMTRRERISEVEGIDAFLIAHHRKLLAALVAGETDEADKLLVQHFEIGETFQKQAMVSELRGES